METSENKFVAFGKDKSVGEDSVIGIVVGFGNLPLVNCSEEGL